MNKNYYIEELTKRVESLEKRLEALERILIGDGK
jgi:chaperonin cofactor prefoldin